MVGTAQSDEACLLRMYLGVFYLPTETRVNAANFLRQSLEQSNRMLACNALFRARCGHKEWIYPHGRLIEFDDVGLRSAGIDGLWRSHSLWDLLDGIRADASEASAGPGKGSCTTGTRIAIHVYKAQCFNSFPQEPDHR
jgi:hypothetical protein